LRLQIRRISNHSNRNISGHRLRRHFNFRTIRTEREKPRIFSRTLYFIILSSEIRSLVGVSRIDKVVLSSHPFLPSRGNLELRWWCPPNTEDMMTRRVHLPRLNPKEPCAVYHIERDHVHPSHIVCAVVRNAVSDLYRYGFCGIIWVRHIPWFCKPSRTRWLLKEGVDAPRNGQCYLRWFAHNDISGGFNVGFNLRNAPSSRICQFPNDNFLGGVGEHIGSVLRMPCFGNLKRTIRDHGEHTE
jgi:hypothetical protein